MAARTTTAVSNTFNRNQTTITGKATGTASTGAISAYKGVGVASVAKAGSGTGLYIITLQDKWAGLLSASFSFIDSGGDHHNATITAIDLAAKTITIKHFAEASAAEPTEAIIDENTTLLFNLTMSDTTQVPNGN